MLARKAAQSAPLVVFVALLTGCAGIGEPKGWLPDAEDAQSQAHGAWIEVRYETGPRESEKIRGEFVAVSDDTVFVFVADYDSQQFAAIPRDDIIRARLSTFDARHGSLAGWTVGGVLTTISHGFFLILTAPLWIITGSASAGAQARRRTERYPNTPWEYLKRFARFPQGLPDTVLRTTLVPKPGDHTPPRRARGRGSRR